MRSVVEGEADDLTGLTRRVDDLHAVHKRQSIDSGGTIGRSRALGRFPVVIRMVERSVRVVLKYWSTRLTCR